MLRCVLNGLLRGRRGHSAVEYAILLGLLTLALGGGAVWLGVSSTRSLSSLAGQMTGPGTEISPTGGPGGNAVSPAAEEPPLKPMPDNGDRIAAASWGALALAHGAIGLGWFLQARRRRRRTRQVAPLGDIEVSDLVERFSAKRHQLLLLLSQDPTVLFRNQLAVRHVMTTELITAPPAATRQRIEELMLESHVRHMLVCGPGQQLLGVVSDRDLSSKPGRTAGELMSKQLKTVSSEALHQSGNHTPSPKRYFIPAGGRRRASMRHPDHDRPDPGVAKRASALAARRIDDAGRSLGAGVHAEDPIAT